MQGDEKLHVEFYMGAVELTYESEKVGHPVYQDCPFIRSTIPGDMNNIIETRVNAYYRNRFAQKWKAFESGMTEQTQGWALEQWPVITTSQVKTLNYLNIKTVEQLAGLSDGQCQKIGIGSDSLRAKAKAAIAAAADSAATNAQASENKQLRDELEALKKMIQNLPQQEEKRGPGRPKKEPETV